MTEANDFSSKYDKLLFGEEKEEQKYSLAKCCNPIAGDKVFGFKTRKDDIKVHKTDCEESIILQSNYANRLITATWVDSSEQEFSVKLKLSGIDTLGLVNEVTKIISSNMNVNIKQINFNTKEGLFIGEIGVFVKNNSRIDKLVKKLNKINGIDKITRE